MAKGNSLLRALSILSLEEILKLSSADKEILAFEQVAGGEWVGASPAKKRRPETMARVLSFPSSPKLQAKDLEPISVEGKTEDNQLNELSLDFILTQRKLWKQGVESMGLAGAVDEYIRHTQAISIKETSSEEQGKCKIRFISTQGLLVDKKQS